MVTKVIWNKAASNTFDDITTYMVDNFSLQSAQSFAAAVYKKNRLHRQISFCWTKS